ncbi:hypothetical protein NL676_012609 [Syzygium grande]|nr:hypothetical protein NL676_012609 [Syzygium grande]
MATTVRINGDGGFLRPLIVQLVRRVLVASSLTIRKSVEAHRMSWKHFKFPGQEIGQNKAAPQLLRDDEWQWSAVAPAA